MFSLGLREINYGKNCRVQKRNSLSFGFKCLIAPTYTMPLQYFVVFCIMEFVKIGTGIIVIVIITIIGIQPWLYLVELQCIIHVDT